MRLVNRVLEGCLDIVSWCAENFVALFLLCAFMAFMGALVVAGTPFEQRRDACLSATCPALYLPTFESRRDPECLCIPGVRPVRDGGL